MGLVSFPHCYNYFSKDFHDSKTGFYSLPYFYDVLMLLLPYCSLRHLSTGRLYNVAIKDLTVQQLKNIYFTLIARSAVKSDNHHTCDRCINLLYTISYIVV